MKRKAKLILGGGAAYGLAHIGVLEAISAEFEVTGIVGTSMGAIIGGLYAMGKAPGDILELALDKNTATVFNPSWVPTRPLKLSYNFFNGLHNPQRIMGLFNLWTGHARIEDMPIPYVAVAYDLNERKTVLIDRGPLASAMRASSSLPLLFAPYEMGNYLFVDGGVEHPLPVAFGDMVPGDLTIAVNVLPPVSTEAEPIELKAPRGPGSLKTHQVVIQAILQNQGFVSIQAMLQRPPDLFIDAHNPQKNMFDLFDVREFYHFGLDAARESLAGSAAPSFMKQMLLRYQALLSRFMKKNQKEV
jgi:NTE family protein